MTIQKTDKLLYQAYLLMTHTPRTIFAHLLSVSKTAFPDVVGCTEEEEEEALDNEPEPVRPPG
jgi:hypothetical protein